MQIMLFRISVLTIFKSNLLYAQAQQESCTITDVCMVALVDLNVPMAKMKENTMGLISLSQFVNDLNPNKHCALIELPEIPKKASKRGLADEEKEIQDHAWGLRQDVDTRWMIPWDVHPSAANHTNRRRFSSGRVMVSVDAADSNIFMTSSELCTAGRPLDEDKVFIPLQRDLLVPESLDPDKDLKLAERKKPSMEAITAQKGMQRQKTLIKSLLKMSGDELKKKPLVIVNLTGFVEEVGCAVPWSLR